MSQVLIKCTKMVSYILQYRYFQGIFLDRNDGRATLPLPSIQGPSAKFISKSNKTVHTLFLSSSSSSLVWLWADFSFTKSVWLWSSCFCKFSIWLFNSRIVCNAKVMKLIRVNKLTLKFQNRYNSTWCDGFLMTFSLSNE